MQSSTADWNTAVTAQSCAIARLPVRRCRHAGVVGSISSASWSRKRFLDEVNNFERSRPEMPLSNVCHEGEDMTDFYCGP